MSTALLLPGQAAAPPGPADMTMMYVMHHAFRRDVADFAAAIEATPVADVRRWSLLLDRWRRFAHELHVHHSKEDEVLWPLLLQRVRAAEDTEAERVLQEMEEEHAVIDPLLARATGAFQHLAAGGEPSAHELLCDTISRFGATLDRHLGHEESAAIEILQRYVGGAEWATLERTRFRPRQSIGEARFFIPWAVKGLPEDALRQVMALGGPPLRVLHAVSRRRFARDEEEVFGPVSGRRPAA